METNVEKTFKFQIMQINLNLLKCIMSLVGTRIFNLNKLSALRLMWGLGNPQTFVLNRMWGGSAGQCVTNDLFKSTINDPYSLGKCKSLFSCSAFISSRGSGSNTRYNNLLDWTQDTVLSIGHCPHHSIGHRRYILYPENISKITSAVLILIIIHPAGCLECKFHERTSGGNN